MDCSHTCRFSAFCDIPRLVFYDDICHSHNWLTFAASWKMTIFAGSFIHRWIGFLIPNNPQLCDVPEKMSTYDG